MDEPTLTGRLLVATPMLSEPEFRRSVVFVIDDDATEGTLGVIVNRPSELPVDDVLGDWSGYATAPAVMFAGGPVGAGSGLALGMPGTDDAPLGWRPLSASADDATVPRLGLIDLDTPPEILGGALGRFRVFAGYTGWSEGQLGAEIEEGAWYVLPALADDVFSAAPGSLWSRVLRRQGGDLALVSTFPDDPTLN
ncbi:putative transcriptional regulator [Nocardiopsis mwathae]|uniref:Putative transcriptional regulator n=1 Tax=Nocardiopsis mwathae TaxID=1472723 RepID=A0A7X0D3M5_9ACTN|nr:YqgE/AlgH family protein [Nocardiopsis mwathae]MBB6170343.1 putative transcriptional regulator [Nocardiopsis mwathae]